MSGWPWHKPKPPVPPPVTVPPSGGRFYQGIACGNPLPDARIASALAMHFDLFRTGIKDATQVSFDQFAKYPVVPLWIIGVYGNTAAGIQRTIAQIRKLTMPSRIELGNELNIGDAPAGMPKMSPADYAVVANATRAEIESRGHTCYYGAVSNLNPDGQMWLAEMLVKAPWITRVSVHRYPYQGQDPSKSPYGSRAAEMTALCTMLGGRRVLVTETGIMCPPVDEATQLASLKQEVGYWRAEPSCDGVVIWVEGGAPQESFGLREGTDGRWRLAGSVFGGAQTQTPTMRAVAVIVYNDASEGIAGAAVSLMTERDAAGDPIWLAGTTDATGILTLTEVPASLSDTQLRVEAEGYVTFDEHLVLDSTNQQIRMGMPPDPGQPNAILLPPLAHAGPQGDILDVKGNFCSRRFDDGTPIFENMYPSWTPERRAEARAKAISGGDTHFQIGNPTTDLDYHDQSHDIDWLESGRMAEYNAFLRELTPYFYPVVYVTGGGGKPDGYYRRFVEAVDADLHDQCIWLVGHEVVPGSECTTRAYCDHAIEMREALGPTPVMANHLGDGRLSFGANPPEADSPYRRWVWPVAWTSVGEPMTWETGTRIGDNAEVDKAAHLDPNAHWEDDEMACYRMTYRNVIVGSLFQLFFYQSANLRPGDNLDPNVEYSIAERAQECLSRVLGDHWHGDPDWFEGMGYRPRAILWEQSEEWFYKDVNGVTREWMLEVWRAWRGYGWQGYGCGD